MYQEARVAEAYEYCRQVTQRASKTFYWGSVFLPPAKRQAIWTIYAFCRKVDDLVDEAPQEEAIRIGHLQGSFSPAQAIDGWRESLTRLYDNGATRNDPVLIAWERMLQEYAVPLEPALELLNGVEMDLKQTRYQNFDELRLYCYRVAGTVGLLTSAIFGYEHEDALAYAVDLGIALQLTNILRDVGEDARNDRIYLPLNEMAQFGYSEANLMDGVINDAFCSLLAFQMQRADEYYRRSLPGIDLLNPDCRLAIRLSSTLYRRILDRICANHFDVFTTRASVPLPTKLMTASSHWFMQQFDIYIKGLHTSRNQSIVSTHR